MWLEKLSSHDAEAITIFLNQIENDFSGRISKITLFGSKARGDDTEESDIDIVVVTKNKFGDLKSQIRELGYAISLEYDVLFNLFAYTQDRWDWMASIRHPLWRSITAEGIDLTPELSPT